MNHSPLMRITSAFIASLMALCPFSMGGNLPTGANVTHGSVGISTNGSRMQIDQISGQAIVNWESFGIGAGHAVNVSQPDASAAMLSRVLGSDPSEIFGSLTANGSFYLVNPNGVYFGPGSSVDVHSLIASTLDISDADFLAGKLAFSGGSGGVITNDGALSAMATIALLAREVRNSGSIAAANVGIAAGQSVVIDEVAGGKIKLKLDRLAGPSAPRLASLDAGSLIRSPGGEIVILSDNDTLFNAGAAIDAGTGFVEVSADDYVLLAGAVTAGELYVDPVDVDVVTDRIEAGAITITASNTISIAAGVTLQSTGDSITLTADDDGDNSGSVTAGTGAVIDAFDQLTISGASIDLGDATVTAIGDVLLTATNSVSLSALTGRKITINAVGDVSASGLLLARNDSEPLVGDITIAGAAISLADIQGDALSDLSITATGGISTGAIIAKSMTIDGTAFTATGSITSPSGTDSIQANGGPVSLAGGSTGALTINGGAISSSAFLSTSGLIINAASAALQGVDTDSGGFDVTVTGAFSTTGILDQGGVSIDAGSVVATGNIHSGPSESEFATVDIMATGDVSVTSISGGIITIAGAAISASGNITAAYSDITISGTSATLADVSSDADLSFDPGGVVDIQVTNALSVGSVDADLDITLSGASIAASGNVMAGDAANITATGAVSLAAAAANNGSLVVSGASVIATGSLASSEEATISATGNLGLASVSGSTLDLDGAAISTGDLTASNGGIFINGDSAHFANASATGGDIAVITTGSIEFDAINVSGNVILSGVGVTESSQVDRSVGGVQGSDIIIAGGAGDVTLGSVQGSDVTISGKAVSGGDITATVTNGDIEVTATEAANFASLNATSGLVNINAVGITVTGATSAAGTVFLTGNAGAVAVQNVTANGAGSPSLQISGDSIQLNGDLLTQGGALNISLQAANDISGMNHLITALGAVTIDSTSGSINLGTDSLIEIDGDLLVTAETSIDLGDIEADAVTIGDNLTTNVTIENSQADAATVVTGGIVNIGYLLAPEGIDLDAGTSITTGEVGFSGNFSADAPTSIALDRVSQSFPSTNIRIGQATAPDTFTGSDMDTGGEILITAGAVDISGSVRANTDGTGNDALNIHATTGALTLFEVSSDGGPLTLEGASIEIDGAGFGGVDAGAGAVVINGNSGSVISDSPIMGASVDIDGAAIDISDTVQSTAGNIDIKGAGVDLADVDSDGGDIRVEGSSVVTFDSLDSEGSITVIGDGMTATGDVTAATSATLNGMAGAVSLTNVTASAGVIDIDGDELSATGNLIATNGSVLVFGQVSVDIDGSIDAGSSGYVYIQSGGSVDLANVTAASKDGSAVGIHIDGTDIHVTDTLTATTGNVDIDGSSAAIDTGIDAKGHVDISTTGTISSFIIESESGAVTLDSVSGDITIASGGHISALQDVSISGTDIVSIAGNIDAGGVVDIGGGSITVTGITARDIAAANRSIIIVSTGTIQLNGDLLTEGSGRNLWIKAAGDILGMNHVITTVGLVDIDSTNGSVNLGAGSLIDSGENIVVFSETGISLGTHNSGLVSGAGKVVLGDNLTANVTVANSATTDGGFVEINGLDVNVASVSANAATAGLGIDIEAGNSIVATGPLLTTGSGDSIQLDAAQDITTSTINAVGDVILDSSNAIDIDNTNAGGDILIGQNMPSDTIATGALTAGGNINVTGGQITVHEDASASAGNIVFSGTKNSGLDLTLKGNVTTQGGSITLDGGGRVILDDGFVLNANGGAIIIDALDEVFINSLVTTGPVSVTSQSKGIYDNGDSHIDIDTTGLVTLSAPDHIGRVNAGDTLVNPAGSTPKAADGNALETHITRLVAATTAADAEIAIDNTGVALLLGPGAAGDLSPSNGAKGALWVRNDLDLTVANWQIDTDDDIGLISTQGNVTIPGKTEVISGLEQELTDADIVIGAGTARLEAAGNILAGGDISVIGGKLVLKSTTAPAIHTLVDSADIALDGPGASVTLTQYNGASGFAADFTVQDLDNDGNAIITNGGVIDVTLMNGYDFVTDDGTLTVDDAVSANHADITFTVNSAASRNDGELVVANSATVATDSSGDKGGSLAISGHVTTNGQLLANTGETLTLSAVPGQITFAGPQAGAGNVTLDPGGSNEHNIIFSPESRLEVNGGTLTITNVDTFGMQGASRIDVRGGDVIVNNALSVHMSPDSSITATGDVSITASQEISLGHITSDTDGNNGDITINNTFAPLPPRANGDVTITGVLNPSGNDLSITATGTILATGFGETVNTNLLTLNAATGIGSSASPIDADALRIDAANTTGAVWINNTPRADVTDLEISTTGNIVYSQQGNALTVNGNGLTSLGGHITIDPPSDIVVAANIDTAGGNLTVMNTGDFTQNTGTTISTAGGDTHTQSGGNVAIDAITTSDILIVSGGTIAETAADAATDITGSSISFIADGNIGILHLAASTRIDASSQGTVNLETAAGFNLGHISGTEITLVSAGAINDANAGDLNLVAPDATLTANGGSITADSALDTVTATASAGITLDESDDITLTSLTSAGDISVTSDGSVTTDAITTDGNTLTVDAENAITIGTAIANGAGDISLRAATGSVSNNASLAGAAIGIAAGDSVIVNASLAGTGIVVLDADNLIDVNSTIGGAQVDITARGTGDTVTADDVIAATAGDVTLNTPNGAILANSAINATGGGVRLSAETTVTATGIAAATELSIVADSTVTTNGALSGADISIDSTTADLDLNGTVIASDSLSLLANTGIDAALALGGTTVSANAATITTHGSVTGNTDFTASGTITTNGNIRGGDINIESTAADLDLNGTVIATDSLSLVAGTAVDAASSLGGSRVTIQAGTISTQAGADILAIGGDITLGAAGAITLREGMISTNDIIITSDAAVSSTAAITATGDINIDAMNISLASAAASNDLYLDGTTGVTTTGNISAASDLTVIGSVLSLGGTVTGGILGQVTLISTGAGITLTNSVSGGGVEIRAVGNAEVDALTSQSGDIHIQATGSINLNDAISGAGSIIVGAGGGIAQTTATALTTVSQVTLRASGGDVSQVPGASVSAGDDIRIDASGDVHVVSYSTTGDDVRIEADGHIIDADGASTVLINAPTATLTMHAFSIGTVASDDLDVDVARLVATTSGLTGDRDLQLDDENTLIVDRAETQDGDVSIDAVNLIIAGTVIARDVNGGNNNDISLEADQDLTVTGFIDADDDADLYAKGDVIMTAGQVAAGDFIDIRADFNFDVNTDHDGNGSISQSGGVVGSGSEGLFAFAADGILLNTSSVANAQLINGNPSGGTASGNIVMHNKGSNLDLVDNGGPFSVSNVAGDTSISNDANINILSAVIGANHISILADGNIALANPATIVSNATGNIIIDAGGTLTLASATLVNATSGAILAEAESDIVLSQLTTTNATASAVTVISLSGSITGEDSQVDIVADSAGAGTTITAATGIGTGGNFLDTTVDTLSAHVTGNGGIWIDENTTVTLADIDTHDGHIVITADDSMLADDIIAGTENILAGNGTVTLTTTTGNITVDTVSAPLDTVNITSAGDLVEDGTDAAADIVGGVINLVSGGLIGLDSNPIEIDALLELNATSTGNVNLTDVIDDFPVGAIDAGSSTVTLLANDDQGGDDVAAIIDAVDGGTDIIAGHAELTALSGIGVGRQGAAGDLDVNVDSLEATVTREGDINIDEVDSIEVTSAITADGDIAVRAADSIAIGIIDGDQNADNDVILWAGANITDAQSGVATDIYAGGFIDLTVDTGAIGTADEILEVIAGDALHLTALDITPRGEFWAVLNGTAGGTDTPRYVTYTGRGDVPPARIFWNGDVIGGQEDQMLTYQETESVFALTRGLTDDIAAFGPTTFLHAALLLDEYYTIRAIDFLHPGLGRVTFPDGTDIIDIQSLVDDAISQPTAMKEQVEEEEAEPEMETTPDEPISAEPSPEQASVKSTPAPILN